MGWCDAGLIGEIGAGSGDPQEPGNGPRAQVVAGDGLFQEFASGCVEAAVKRQSRIGQIGVGAALTMLGAFTRSHHA